RTAVMGGRTGCRSQGIRRSDHPGHHTEGKMDTKRRESVRGNPRAVRAVTVPAKGRRSSAVAAESLESRVMLSQTSHVAAAAAARADSAAVRAILARPVQKATAAQLAQIAQVGLAPI